LLHDYQLALREDRLPTAQSPLRYCVAPPTIGLLLNSAATVERKADFADVVSD
jgi:hypothetical protein